jgi:hypothetical protein
MYVIPALGRLKQDHDFEATLNYTLRPNHKKEKKKKTDPVMM